jgi:hypothetical protein
MDGNMITRVLLTIIPIMILTACIGDPIYSIKHTVKFDGKLTHECFNAAANSIKDVSIIKIEDRYGERDFDEYIVSNSKVEIEVLWFKADRMTVELSTMGIGYAEKERDSNTCDLIREFKKSLIDACQLNKERITVNKEYMRSGCDDQPI